MPTTNPHWPSLQGRSREQALEKPAYCYVIHRYYTGRDKGALRARKEPTPESPANVTDVLLFRSPGHAWWYVFHVAQPNDQRAMDNYRVVTLAEYRA